MMMKVAVFANLLYAKSQPFHVFEQEVNEFMVGKMVHEVIPNINDQNYVLTIVYDDEVINK